MLERNPFLRRRWGTGTAAQRGWGCFFPRGAQGKAGWGPDLMRGSQLMAGGWNQMDFIMSPPTYATVWKRIFRNNFQIKKKPQLKHRKKIKYPKSTDILAGVQSRGLQCSTGQFPLCQHLNSRKIFSWKLTMETEYECKSSGEAAAAPVRTTPGIYKCMRHTCHWQLTNLHFFFKPSFFSCLLYAHEIRKVKKITSEILSSESSFL